MHFFTTVAALALVATVSAQNSTFALTSSSTSTSASPQSTCLAKCAAADICCQAACVNVPCPSQMQANATTECAARCPQGNGSYVETQQYASCQASCISSNFLSTSTGTASTSSGSNTATGTSGSSSLTSSGTTSTSNGARSSASSTATGTRSGSASSSSSTGNAAPETRAAIAGAGLFGLIIAGLML